MLQLGSFVVGSAVLVWLSRSALRQPHSHGFSRFFAWEAILALLVLNLPVWFEDRFAPHQLVSWALLFGSIAVLIAGLTLMRRLGKPDQSRTDAELFAFEKTSTLVTSGIFSYIRHPLYTSLLLLTWGIFFKRIDLAGLLFALTATFFLWLTARRDEDECLAHFGEPYRQYMRRSKRFIPFVI